MKTNTLEFDAQALREKILDLAMRGKLVPQDPDDEPASVLLEKIKAEKEQLIKEKRIKKSKPLPEITDDEKPFDVPESWEWVRLGEVFEVTSSKRVMKKEWQNEGIPFYRAREIVSIKNNRPLKDPIFLSESTYNEKIKVSGVPMVDDILLTGVGTLGIPYIVKDNKKFYFKDGNIIWLKNISDINSQYLSYYIQSPYMVKEINNGRGTTVATLTIVRAKDLMIPLPPLEEQSRIAAKIAQLFALLRKVESSTQQYAKLQTLLKSKVLDLAMRGKLVEQDPHDEPASVLLEKIKVEKEQLIKEKKIKKSKPLPPITDAEKPFKIPDSWEWVRLGDIVSSVTKGTTPKGGKKAYVSKGINYYRAENVAISGLSKQNLNHITSDIHNGPLKRSILKENDILITIAGTLGRVTYVKKEDLPGNTNQAVSISRPINRNEINEKFLVYILASSIQRVVKNNKTTSIPNLTLQQIAETIFPFPPLSEQNRIVSKIVRLFTLLKK
ncbi:restriction endonuclease subunit S [Lactobacillus taiwanensis]|uniref:restriction endonuclease subunit S n=1 Tax=Lactobacillus taiwanensis TaxID=508451 RepID=UPI0025AFB067|nr:restriction endonuclease subunit S [Lactobacillus taiwanensis]